MLEDLQVAKEELDESIERDLVEQEPAFKVWLEKAKAETAKSGWALIAKYDETIGHQGVGSSPVTKEDATAKLNAQ